MANALLFSRDDRLYSEAKGIIQRALDTLTFKKDAIELTYAGIPLSKGKNYRQYENIIYSEAVLSSINKESFIETFAPALEVQGDLDVAYKTLVKYAERPAVFKTTFKSLNTMLREADASLNSEYALVRDLRTPQFGGVALYKYLSENNIMQPEDNFIKLADGTMLDVNFILDGGLTNATAGFIGYTLDVTSIFNSAEEPEDAKRYHELSQEASKQFSDDLVDQGKKLVTYPIYLDTGADENAVRLYKIEGEDIDKILVINIKSSKNFPATSSGVILKNLYTGEYKFVDISELNQYPIIQAVLAYKDQAFFDLYDLEDVTKQFKFFPITKLVWGKGKNNFEVDDFDVYTLYKADEESPEGEYPSEDDMDDEERSEDTKRLERDDRQDSEDDDLTVEGFLSKILNFRKLLRDTRYNGKSLYYDKTVKKLRYGLEEGYKDLGIDLDEMADNLIHTQRRSLKKAIDKAGGESGWLSDLKQGSRSALGTCVSLTDTSQAARAYYYYFFEKLFKKFNSDNNALTIFSNGFNFGLKWSSIHKYKQDTPINKPKTRIREDIYGVTVIPKNEFIVHPDNMDRAKAAHLEEFFKRSHRLTMTSQGFINLTLFNYDNIESRIEHLGEEVDKWCSAYDVVFYKQNRYGKCTMYRVSDLALDVRDDDSFSYQNPIQDYSAVNALIDAHDLPEDYLTTEQVRGWLKDGKDFPKGILGTIDHVISEGLIYEGSKLMQELILKLKSDAIVNEARFTTTSVSRQKANFAGYKLRINRVQMWTVPLELNTYNSLDYRYKLQLTKTCGTLLTTSIVRATKTLLGRLLQIGAIVLEVVITIYTGGGYQGIKAVAIQVAKSLITSYIKNLIIDIIVKAGLPPEVAGIAVLVANLVIAGKAGKLDFDLSDISKTIDTATVVGNAALSALSTYNQAQAINLQRAIEIQGKKLQNDLKNKQLKLLKILEDYNNQELDVSQALEYLNRYASPEEWFSHSLELDLNKYSELNQFKKQLA